MADKEKIPAVDNKKKPVKVIKAGDMSPETKALPDPNFLVLSAFINSSPTDFDIPTFLAKVGLLATAAIKSCCFLDLLGI